MKKQIGLLAMVLGSVLCLSLPACGGDNSELVGVGGQGGQNVTPPITPNSTISFTLNYTSSITTNPPTFEVKFFDVTDGYTLFSGQAVTMQSGGTVTENLDCVLADLICVGGQVNSNPVEPIGVSLSGDQNCKTGGPCCYSCGGVPPTIFVQ